MFGRITSTELPDVQELGDRHLHGILNGTKLASGVQYDVPVQVIADPTYVSTLQGQHMLFMLVDLLCRQFGVVGRIHIEIPDVATCASYESMGVRLPQAIRNSIASVSLGRVDVFTSPAEDGAVTLAVGFPLSAGCRNVTYAWADGWNVYVGRDVVQVEPSEISFPIGAYFGACLLAAEAFKRVAHMKAQFGNYADSVYLSLWTGRRYRKWSDMPKGPDFTRIQLPELVIVGMGAVGQAVSLTLGMLPGVSIPRLVLIDRDKYESTNHNRCILSDTTDIAVETPKVEIAKRFFDSRGIEANIFEGLWQEFVYESPYRNPHFKYNWVLSCVDRNIARHAIQSFWPSYILGGSTVNMTANVTMYQSGSKYECMKCFNKPEESNASPEEIREVLLEQDNEAFLRLCKKAGANPTLVREYLATAQCGSLAEAEVRKFDSTTIEPSVGFASVGAGVLLVAQLLRCVIGGVEQAFPTAHNLLFSFMQLKEAAFPVLARTGCECQTRLGHGA